MIKKCYRFYGGMMRSQEKWLNKMAASGYRLIRTGKLLYEFDECELKEYQYCVEFIGNKSKDSVNDYINFLEDFGYQVFFKNINLNWNVDRAELRPWAEKGGRIATNSTTLHRELLIVEKKNDGKPFELHTTYEDKIWYYKQLRKPWLYMLLVYGMLGVFLKSWVWIIFAVISVIGLIVLQVELAKLRKQEKSKEW